MPRKKQAEEPMVEEEEETPAAAPNSEEPMEQETAATSEANFTFNARGLPDLPEIEVPPAPEAVASFDATGPRLMITHIVNDYFKSYAGKQTLGPFHKSFSSIIGPNGSGKSNVIDSMLFVFGYRANKIRSKKISVLIHNSEQHPNCQSCTVAVHFLKIIDTGLGDDDFDVVPNSQFVVSRTAFKDNSSYYKVNDKKVQYKEVAALLRGSGIDLDHNRFLILQGEVEQIAMMKPKAQTEHDEGMLEFLEDIIGSSRFKEPIEQLTKRVEMLNELRAEKLNRVKAVEKEKDELEGVKNEAIEYLKLENDITKKKNELWQHYKLQLTENQDKATKKMEEIQDGMKETTAKLNEITEAKKVKGKEQKKIFKKHEQLAKECEDKKEQFSAFEQEDVRCREDLKHAKAKSKKLEKTFEQDKKRLSELKLIPEKTERDIVDFKKKQEKLEVEKAKEDEKLKEVMDSLKTETQGLQAEKDVKETELLELQKSVNETKSTMNVAQSELELYMKNQQKEQMKLKETTKHYELATNKLKDRTDGIKELGKRIPENEKALDKARRDLEQAAQEETRLQAEVRQTRIKVEEARSSMSASKSRGRILEALMAEKHAGRIPGIFGRLGDLGAIDEKYDVAVSTACGPLDNIVVDTINTAQKCVEFLRRSGIGSATFMGLDKMKRWEGHCSRRIATPENVPRLFDLVKVKDPQILPAFYFALRDTLVANDLEQGTRIAYGRTRYRVVTLQGQLIDLSGTMSGGGSRVSRGRMSSKVVDEEVDPQALQKLEQTLQKASQEAQTVHQNKVELERMIEKLQKSLTDMRHSLQKFKAEVQSLTEQERDLKAQMAEQQEKVKAAAPDEKTLKELEKKLEGYRKVYKKAQDAASKVEDEVHVLHKQIMEVGGAKLKSAEMRVSHITMQIDQIVGHITKANVAIKNAQRNTKKCEEKVTSIEEEQKENAELITKLEAEFKKLEEDATKVLQEYQKAQEEMKAVDEEVAAMAEELRKLEEEEEKIQKDNMEVKHELEQVETIIKENAHKIKHWKKELGKLSLHEIDGIEKETLAELSKENLEDSDSEDIKYQITVLEEKVAQMKPNMAAIAEYKKKETQYLKRVGELDEITEFRDGQRKRHDDMRRTRADEFMTGFGIITNKLKEMYQMITLGGDAELELVDTLDPFAEGIVFSVRPPKKSWKNISNLSGGEKTLSSLALVFALHHYKPTPLYVMDEIDAALDFKNVSIVANYIKERTKNAQFIIISLRNNMFELADRLIGIYKTYNATKSVTVNPKRIGVSEIEAAAAAIKSSGAPSKSALTAATAAINEAAAGMDIETAA